MTLDRRPIPKCAPRKSGLTRVQLVLLGKGPSTRADRTWFKRRPGDA